MGESVLRAARFEEQKERDEAFNFVLRQMPGPKFAQVGFRLGWSRNFSTKTRKLSAWMATDTIQPPEKCRQKQSASAV
jgi:hypothetical protein